MSVISNISLNSNKSYNYPNKSSNGLPKSFVPQIQYSMNGNYQSLHYNKSGLNSCLTNCSNSSQMSYNYPNRSQQMYQNFSLSQKDCLAFKRLLDEPIVETLLNWDKCCLLADNYLLATAMVYFKRAKLRHQQYTPCYLFVALYLAHDMEEDDLDLKNDLISFAMSQCVSNCKRKLFLRKRDKLWHAMDYRSCVNHICCEAIMNYCLPQHKIWRRERHSSHGGVCFPSHIKSLIHRELRLANSYVDCNIRCIICESRHFMTEYRSVKSVAKETHAFQLSVDSQPFYPQNMSLLKSFYFSTQDEE